MKIGFIISDNFTDIDFFILWDILNRDTGFTCVILGDQSQHISKSGIPIKTDAQLEDATSCDVVIFTSGPAIQKHILSPPYLRRLNLNHQKQIIASQCSGALLLAKLGFLEKIPATTYGTRQKQLQNLGVTVVQKPFVANGNIATAGGCYASFYLAAWVLQKTLGTKKRQDILNSVAPVGEEIDFENKIESIIFN